MSNDLVLRAELSTIYDCIIHGTYISARLESDLEAAEINALIAREKRLREAFVNAGIKILELAKK